MLHKTKPERLANDKHSNLNVQLVSYEEKEILWIRPQKLKTMLDTVNYVNVNQTLLKKYSVKLTLKFLTKFCARLNYVTKTEQKLYNLFYFGVIRYKNVLPLINNVVTCCKKRFVFQNKLKLLLNIILFDTWTLHLFTVHIIKMKCLAVALKFCKLKTHMFTPQTSSDVSFLTH